MRWRSGSRRVAGYLLTTAWGCDVADATIPVSHTLTLRSGEPSSANARNDLTAARIATPRPLIATSRTPTATSKIVTVDSRPRPTSTRSMRLGSMANASASISRPMPSIVLLSRNATVAFVRSATL